MSTVWASLRRAGPGRCLSSHADGHRVHSVLNLTVVLCRQIPVLENRQRRALPMVTGRVSVATVHGDQLADSTLHQSNLRAGRRKVVNDEVDEAAGESSALDEPAGDARRGVHG